MAGQLCVERARKGKVNSRPAPPRSASLDRLAQDAFRRAQAGKAAIWDPLFFQARVELDGP
jgi:hypothetical protein